MATLRRGATACGRAFALAAALGLAVPLAPPAAAASTTETPLEKGRARLDALGALLRRESASDGEVVAAVAAVRESYTAVLGGGRPPADPSGREEEQFARAVETALLRLVGMPQRDRRAKEDDRHGVRVAAVRALGWARPSVAPALRQVLADQVYRERDLAPFPSFHDEAFDTILRLDREGSWEWMLVEAVNCDNQPASVARNLAALDALRGVPAPTAKMRIAGVRRLVAIFQAPDAFWNDWYEEITGSRASQYRKLTKWAYGQFWLDIRDAVIETLRRLATDPITGAPPLDPDDGTEMFVVRRYITWQARNRPQPVAPWVDPPPGAPPVAFPPRPKVSPIETMFGIPWERWWRENRRLETPPGYATEAGFDREAHRTAALPAILAPFLDDADPVVRAAAAVQLGRTGAEGAGTRLQGLLAPDQAPVVRGGAALGLLVLGDPTRRDLLRALASEPAEPLRVRGAAILALGSIGDRAHVRATFLETREPVPDDLRACAVAALGLSADPADAELLAALLLDRSAPDGVRGQVGTALLRMRAPAAGDALMAVLAKAGTGKEPHAPEVAAALAWVGCVAADDRRGWVSLGALFSRYDDRFGGTRNALLAGLGRVQSPHAGRFLATQYAACRADFRRPAEVGFHLLALGHQGTEGARTILREGLAALAHERDLGACALALALHGDRESAPAILALLERSERYCVAPAMLALGMLGHREAVAPIRDRLARRRDVAALENGGLALALLLGPGALADLTALWDRAREWELLDGLAEAFRVAAAPDAVEWLRARAADPGRPSMERAAALSALGRMGQDAEGTVLDRLARDYNPFTGATTLDGIARHRDLAPLRTTDR